MAKSALAKLVLTNIVATEAAGVGLPGVIPVIDRVLALETQPDDRRDGKFHPSDLSKDFCPRAWVLYNTHPDGLAVKGGAQSPQLKRIFGVGHAVHSRIQRYLRDALFGTWQRIVGLNDDGSPKFERVSNVFCPGPHWEYAEVALMHGEENILGHTDGILRLEAAKDVLEVKSINPEMFKWLADRPHTAHEIQVDIYLYCLEWIRQQYAALTLVLDDNVRFALRPIDGVWVLYECKGTQAFKQYYIPNDPARVETTMLGLRGRMRAALLHKKTGELPACTCPKGKRAALCVKLKHMPLTVELGEQVVEEAEPVVLLPAAQSIAAAVATQLRATAPSFVAANNEWDDL